MPKHVYLDHNATTRPLPGVSAAMAEAMQGGWANPSSVHTLGRQARAWVEDARRHVAELIAADSEEVVFTSGGTEGDWAGIWGLAHLGRRRRGGPYQTDLTIPKPTSFAERLEAAKQTPLFSVPKPTTGAIPARFDSVTESAGHVLSSPLEHPAVIGALMRLLQEGFDVEFCPVDDAGRVDLVEFERRLRPDTVLCTWALANHEIGNIYPIAAMADMARARGILFHTDAVQGVGKIPVDVMSLGVDALTLTAHKIHGPKGAGALFVKKGLEQEIFIAGGHQERERRGGTENVPGIAGFGVASKVMSEQVTESGAQVSALRDHLEEGLLKIPGPD